MKVELINHDKYSVDVDLDTIMTLYFNKAISIDISKSPDDDGSYIAYTFNRDGTGDYVSTDLVWSSLPTEIEIIEEDYTGYVKKHQ